MYISVVARTRFVLFRVVVARKLAKILGQRDTVNSTDDSYIYSASIRAYFYTEAK